MIGSQWSIGTLLYKQRWFREILDAMPEQDWLTVRPLTIVALAEELTDQTLDGVYLWKRYPNVNTRLMIGIIGEETRALDEHFHYEALPGRDFYFVIFRDRGMRERFLDDDPAFRATFEPILRDAIPNIYTRLEAENGNL